MGEDDDFASITGEWKRDTTTPVDADTPVEQRFLLQLRDTPTDLEMRMVFADWLEERGYPNKAEVVRLNADPPVEGSEAMRQLRHASQFLDPDWLAMVSRGAIDNCLRITCPRTWDNLTSTDRPCVRQCATCNRSIHFCGTFHDIREHGQAGSCVVFSSTLAPSDARRAYTAAAAELEFADLVTDEIDVAQATMLGPVVGGQPIGGDDEGGTVYADEFDPAAVTPDD